MRHAWMDGTAPNLYPAKPKPSSSSVCAHCGVVRLAAREADGSMSKCPRGTLEVPGNG